MNWWIYIALKQLFPTGKKISFFAIVSILGVAVGVTALLGTQSVMNGFHEQIGVKLRDTTGDITIVNTGYVIKDASKLAKDLEQYKEVERAECVIQGPVMMTFSNQPSFPILRSFDTIGGNSALPIKEKNFVDKKVLGELDDDSIIIGSRLAMNMGAYEGDYVNIYSPTMLDKLNKNEVPMPARLKVIGILSSGFSETDLNTALVSYRRMKELYSFGGDTAQNITAKLKDSVDCKDFTKKLDKEVRQKLRGNYRAKSWLENNEAFLRVIYMEKTMMSLIIMLVILVASFSICISLYTSVLRKTKEIGLISAMGGRPMQIVFCYCFQGLLIGIFGALSGLLLTFTILYFRQGIVDLTLGSETITEFYFLTRLPVKYEINDIVTTSVFAIGLCTLAGFIPAYLASKLKASEAMRNE